MNIEIKEKNEYTREMVVTVPWEELEASFNRSVVQFSRSITLPGYRKGKVPRKVLFKMFGPEIEAEFIQQAIKDYYVEALEKEAITPVNQANIKDLSFKQGEPLEFTAEFEVEPKVNLPDYEKKFKIRKNVYLPDDEDVDIYIQELRQQHAVLRTVEDGSQEGHLLLVDIQELDSSGVPVIGRKVEDRYIKVGEGIFGGENLNKLTNLKVGDVITIEVETQSGKNFVKYQLTIKNVQEEVLPELDEEFIKKVDSSAQNESEFRQNVLKKIQTKLNYDAEMQFNQAISDYFIQNADLAVPPSMVDHYLERMVEDAKSRNGESFDERRFREEYKSAAIRDIKWYLIRKALIDKIGLEVTDEEITEKVNEIVQGYGEESEQIRRYYRKPSNRENLREDLLDRKLMDYLKEFVKIEEVKIHTKDIRKRQDSTLL